MSHNITVVGGSSVRLPTAGKYCDRDIVVTATKAESEVDLYEGSYDVTPKVDAQSLATKDKFMTDDVRIHEIPYFDVGNTSGGSTVYIGTLEELVGTTAILGTAKLGVMTL